MRRKDRKLKSELEFLKTVKLYLEKKPREEFVKKQLDEAEYKSKQIQDNYYSWDGPYDIPDRRKAYNSAMGLNKIKKQIKILKFILE